LFAQNNEVYISDFVLKELKINLKENENIELLNNDIANFIALSNFKVMQSNILRSKFVRYVEDFEDAQILQDAFDIRADYILIQNLKDFDIQ
jgi:predicted nucleic acid-binding protein